MNLRSFQPVKWLQVFLWASQFRTQPVHGQGYHILIFLDRMHLLFTRVHFLFSQPGQVRVNNNLYTIVLSWVKACQPLLGYFLQKLVFFYKQLSGWVRLIGLVGRVFTNALGDQGSLWETRVHSQVESYQRLKK